MPSRSLASEVRGGAFGGGGSVGRHGKMGRQRDRIVNPGIRITRTLLYVRVVCRCALSPYVAAPDKLCGCTLCVASLLWVTRNIYRSAISNFRYCRNDSKFVIITHT
jgi:hypothetical protein